MISMIGSQGAIIMKYLLVSVVALLFGVRPVIAENSQPLRVGAVLPLTGPLSVQGVPFKNAMVLAQEELDPEHHIDLVFEDDVFLPRNTVSATKKLFEKDNIGALIVFGTNQGLAVADMAEQRRVPFLSINVNRAVVQNRKFASLLMPPLEVLTALNIAEAKRRNYQRIATVASIQDSCLLQKKIFEAARIGVLVSSQEIDPQDRELRSVALRLLDGKPDAIFLSTLPPQGALLAKSLRQLGYRGELFGGIQTAYLSELQASDGALENGWIVSAEDRHAERYYARYRRRFSSEPTDLSMYAYDAINLLIEGRKTADLNQFLHSVRDFNGISGTFSSDGENGYTFQVALKQFTRTGYRYLP